MEPRVTTRYVRAGDALRWEGRKRNSLSVAALWPLLPRLPSTLPPSLCVAGGAAGRCSGPVCAFEAAT